MAGQKILSVLICLIIIMIGSSFYIILNKKNHIKNFNRLSNALQLKFIYNYKN